MSNETDRADERAERRFQIQVQRNLSRNFMSLELLGGRVLAPYFGSSIYVWGSVITVFMDGPTRANTLHCLRHIDTHVRQNLHLAG